MKKSIFILSTVVLALVFLMGSAIAATPSAKFAATWSEDLALAAVADTGDVTTGTVVYIDSKNGHTLTTIKVPQDKELLVGVSAEIGILTDTSIKGRNGGSAKALAGGAAWVTIVAEPVDGGDDVEAEPGTVILSGRIQVLEATLGGVIDSCEDTTGGPYYPDPINSPELVLYPGDEGYVDTPDGVIDVALECVVTDEEIGLLQATASANHFNFLLPNMDAGVYEIKAYFTTTAVAGVDVCDECGGSVTASGYAIAVVGKTMLTVQQVRAAKGTLGQTEIIEP